MKNEKQKVIDAEIIEPKEVILVQTNSISTVALFKQHFLLSPPIQNLKQPCLAPEDFEPPFPARFGTAIIFTIQYVEFAISPEGTLRAFTKLFARWFFALTIICIAIGLPLLLAAQFLNSIAGLIESAMKHLFFASLWFFGTIAVLAILIVAIIFLYNRKKPR
jgi:magnesium-transporting ATPase (P-type)